ncbi:MAG: phytanoyl-CoA dioxygenase family protein [Candidatus Phosphoribacter sp.]
MNPDAQILLLVSHQVLDPGAQDRLGEFARRTALDVRDLADLNARDDDEAVLLEHVRAEILAHFVSPASGAGNLSVVSDYVRLLCDVVEFGLCADMDIEFTEPFAPSTVRVEASWGIIARHKNNECLSNDVTAGRSDAAPFVIARHGAASLARAYREQSCRYLRERYGVKLDADADAVARHPAFFELRNLRHDPLMSGSARFSLAGGPDNLAIAAHLAGIASGFGQGVVPGVEFGELVPGHVPHQLSPAQRGELRYEPYDFGSAAPAQVRADHRAALWPECLPGVVAHWDHSWIAEHDWQQPLTFREGLLLERLEREPWSVDAVASSCGGRPLPSCLLSPPSGDLGDDNMSGYTTKAGLPDLIRPQAVQRVGVAVTDVADDGTDNVAAFRRDGIVTLAGLVDSQTLSDLQESFDTEIRAKGVVSALQQTSFNLAVDSCARETLERVRDMAHLPALIQVLDEYFEGPSRFVSARGYRQGPCKPLRYRAWDYHQDMKTSGPRQELKLMLLLTDVSPGGQAMRYVVGSQRMQWRFATQRETKFSLDEALAMGSEAGSGGLFVADGPAGSAVVFDTNGIHSGHRNLSETRDAITLNFARDSPTTFYMFSHALLMRSRDISRADPPGGRVLKWRLGPVSPTQLEEIRVEYAATPSLADLARPWDRDAEGLVDVMATDVNADLDLRLSRTFEGDRGRDIALVRIRDAGLDDEQYAEVVTRLDGSSCMAPCFWESSEPLASAVAAVERVRHLLALLPEDDAVNCDALMDDLAEALGRCDSVQRLRTTVAYLSLASGWAHRLTIQAGAGGCEEASRQLLDLYTHVVAESDGRGLTGMVRE